MSKLSQNPSQEMGDYLSETESDTSSIMGDSAPSPATREQLTKRIESLLQENRVLKVELETYKLRVKTLQEETKTLKQASVLIQAKAEVEEEFISNTLLKKIQELKKEKEALALNYEQEEECLTNDLSRKLSQLRQEKAHLAHSLQQEQESLVNKLMRKIRKLESETTAKQSNLDQLRREKVELENTLEQEQEALVNRLWKRMDKLEAEKRYLQQKLEQPVSAPPSPMEVSANGGSDLMPSPAHQSSDPMGEGEGGGGGGGSVFLPRPTAAGGRHSSASKSDPATLLKSIQSLRGEVVNLKGQLKTAQSNRREKLTQYSREEQKMREENLLLRRKLEMELERRQELCRHLSESESSLEMEGERDFNDKSSHGLIPHPPASAAVAAAASGGAGGPSAASSIRSRTTSTPIAYPARPVSPAMGILNVSVGSSAACSPPGSLTHRCGACGSLLGPSQLLTATAPVPVSAPLVFTPASSQPAAFRTKSGERGENFVRPANPPTPKAISPSPSPNPPVSIESIDSADAPPPPK